VCTNFGFSSGCSTLWATSANQNGIYVWDIMKKKEKKKEEEKKTMRKRNEKNKMNKKTVQS